MSVYSANQGLGLLINLVEYSSRNRHCLVDMEYSLDNTCLEDSLMLPADPTQADAAAALASTPPSTAETQGDTSDKPKSTGALAALVKVGAVPGLDKCLSFQITVFTETGGDAGSGQKKKFLQFRFKHRSGTSVNTDERDEILLCYLIISHHQHYLTTQPFTLPINEF